MNASVETADIFSIGSPFPGSSVTFDSNSGTALDLKVAVQGDLSIERSNFFNWYICAPGHLDWSLSYNR